MQQFVLSASRVSEVQVLGLEILTRPAQEQYTLGQAMGYLVLTGTVLSLAACVDLEYLKHMPGFIRFKFRCLVETDSNSIKLSRIWESVLWIYTVLSQ